MFPKCTGKGHLLNRLRALAILSAAAISVSGISFSAPAVRAEAKVGQLRLISAGVDYILAEERFSLKDVENEVIAYRAAQEAAAAQALEAAPEEAADTRAQIGANLLSAGLDLSPIDPVVEAIPEEEIATAEQTVTEIPAEIEAVSETTAETSETTEAVSTAAETEETAEETETSSVTGETEQQTKEQSAAAETQQETAEETAETQKEAEEAPASAAEVTAPKEEAAASGQTEEEKKPAGLRDLLKNPAETAETVVGGTEKIIVELAAEDTISVDEVVEEAVKAAEEEKAKAEEEAKQAEAIRNGEELVVARVDDFVYVREEPNSESDYAGKLYANGVGKVLEPDDGSGWVKVQSGDVVGYVKAEFLASGIYAKELASEVASQKAKVTADTLRVRAAADAESDVITLIPMGEEFDVLEELDGWLKVNTPDGEGYISADFADVEDFYPEAESKIAEAERLAEEARKAQAQRQAAGGSTGSSGGRSYQGNGTYLATSDGSSRQQEVANFALQFLGNPYVWGGSSLTNGTDCSGFTMAVYAHFGVSLPHYDASQRSCGSAVSSLSEALPGDLICYNGHVGIYIGGGQIVHASNPSSGIKVSNAAYRQIVAIRRIFN